MRKVEPERVPEDGELILLTVEDVRAGEELKMADFRDSYALFYEGADRWLGLSREGVRLGKGPFRMWDGVWLCQEDREACAALPNHTPDLTRVFLRLIP